MSTALVQRAPDAPVPARRSSLRKVLQLMIVLPIASAIAWYGHEWFTVGRFMISTDDAQVGGEVAAVASNMSGPISRVVVTDNQAVRAGDLLLSLDDRAYRAALTQAEVKVAEQQATLGYLDGIQRLQDASGGTGLRVSQQALFETQRRQIRATLAAAITDRDAARLRLGYTELRAPLDGIVDLHGVRVGALAEAGSPLVAILPPQVLWVDANFDENQLARMRPGQAATIQAIKLPNEVFHGRVVGRAPGTGGQKVANDGGEATSIVRRGTVRIALDQRASAPGLLSPGLRPGLRVTAKVDLRQPQ